MKTRNSTYTKRNQLVQGNTKQTNKKKQKKSRRINKTINKHDNDHSCESPRPQSNKVSGICTNCNVKINSRRSFCQRCATQVSFCDSTSNTDHIQPRCVIINNTNHIYNYDIREVECRTLCDSWGKLN